MSFNLASITRGPAITPPRLVVYGPAGCGKTTFASEAPSPILLPIEDGIGNIQMAKFKIAKTWANVVDAISALHGEHDFKTAVVDSVDWLEPLVWAETCARNKWSDIEQPGFGKGYIAADDVWREFFDGLVSLRDNKGMQVILIAHHQIKAFNDPSNEPYDRYSPKLQARASALLQEWADAVLFMNQKTYTQKTEKGFKAVVTRGVGLGERVIYTEERPSHLAKSRYGLPAEIPAPRGGSYAALAKHLFPNQA